MSLNFQPQSLALPDLGMVLDPHRPAKFAFVSHGHADHFARHDRVLCSPGTGHILQRRYGLAAEKIQTLDWETPLEIRGHKITLFPAGHIVGSAMILVEHQGESLLYTGDFKTRESLTAEAPIFPKADLLAMETTFGRPHFVFPPAEETHAEMIDFATAALADQETPIFFAYSLGKAQEALAILSAAKVPVIVHKTVFEMTQACRELGVDLPEPVLMENTIPSGVAVIAPPNSVRHRLLRNHKKRRTAMLSGWALTPGSKFRYQVDEVFPLSDHADYPGLLEAVERVSPLVVYTLHGSTREFAADLRSRGYQAWSIYGDDQLDLISVSNAHPAESSITDLSRPMCELQELGDLLESLATTNSRLAKTSQLSEFLRKLDDENLLFITSWLSGGGVDQLGTAIIRQALLDLTRVPLARYKAISSQQNDSARTARLLLEEAEVEPEPYSFEEVAARFDRLSKASGSLAKIQSLADWLRKTHPKEGETIVRILTGGLRAGAKEGVVEEAVAEAFSQKPADIRYASMLTGNLGETALAAKHAKLDEIQLRLGSAIKPMLAAPTKTAAEILDWHGDPAKPLWLEQKYDGIRAQLHVLEDSARLFSRDLRSLGHEFPELIEAARDLPACILDGEIIAYAEGKKLTFFDLQKRLGRKKVQGDLFLGAAVPVRFLAFDCLHSGESLIGRPLHERRKELENLPFSGPFSAVSLKRPVGDDLDALEEEFKAALASDNEGLIAKDPDSRYQPGRRGKSWRKLKGVLPTLDCVVVAAQQGHGKRAGVLSDYTFAVRDSKSDELRTLGKAYSGLTDEEIEELTDHFEKTAIEKISSRVIRVKPTIVLEIAFDRVRPSKRHDSGLALRFPRIKAIRRDKSLEEIDTLQTARRLVS